MVGDGGRLLGVERDEGVWWIADEGTVGSKPGWRRRRRKRMEFVVVFEGKGMGCLCGVWKGDLRRDKDTVSINFGDTFYPIRKV